MDTSIRPFALYPLDLDRATAGEAKRNLAQTFTAGATGMLDAVHLPIACVEGVQFRLQLRIGDPDGPLLYDRRYQPATHGKGGFLNLPVFGGVLIREGTVYALVLSSAPVIGAGATCSIAAGPEGDPYAPGHAFQNVPGATADYWAPLSASGRDDLPFRTVMR